MERKQIIPASLYIRKIINTFFPRFLFRLSPKRFQAQRYWRSQNHGDRHGFNKYTSSDRTQIITPIIMHEIRSRLQQDSQIIDLGCNCGYYLAQLQKAGFINLSGIDISSAAIHYGKEYFNFNNVNLIIGSFEDILPKLVSDGEQFDLVYTLGATVELVHPSFDIVGNICKISKNYIILIINEWGHSYPRFWEYEFNKNGFWLVKCIRPPNGSAFGGLAISSESLMVFQRMGDGISTEWYKK